MPSRLAKCSFFALLWAGSGLLLSAEVYFTMRVMDSEPKFLAVAVWQFMRVTVWALLAPVILRLRVLVRPSAGHWAGGVSFHLLMSVLVMAGYYLARIVYTLLQKDLGWGSFWEMADTHFHGRNLIDVAFYWAVLGVGYSLEIYRRYKNEQVKAAQLESRLVESELTALKQQLQPHFLFNTMNTIAVLVRERRNDEAVSLLSKLSALLRVSLDSSRRQEVTLREEMEFVQRYIEIQKIRFADRLTVRTAITPAAFEARIPNLLLQPLVENAILHGVASKAGPGTVEVNGDVRDDVLHLEIRDDGPGFRPVTGAKPNEGIGLSTTRERLAKLYGHRGQLVVRTEPGRGTTVSIVLPRRA